MHTPNTSNLIHLKDRSVEHGPHEGGNVQCAACSYRYVAVAPVGAVYPFHCHKCFEWAVFWEEAAASSL